MTNGSEWTHDDDLDAEVLTITVGDFVWSGAVARDALSNDPTAVAALMAESAVEAFARYCDDTQAQ